MSLINLKQLSLLMSAVNQKFKKSRGNWNQNDPTADDYIKNRPFYEDKNGVHKIDEKYLPVGGTPDWNQNDATTAGYIKNRTHYEDVNRELIATVSCADAYSIGQGHYVVDLPGGFTGTKMVSGGTYQLSIDGMTYDLKDVTEPSNIRFRALDVMLSDGTSLGTVVVGTQHNHISFSNGYKVSDWSKYTITIYSTVAVTIKQLDEKFIPDTIARKSDIPENGGGSEATDEEVINLIAQCNIVVPVTDETNCVYTDENEKILVI